MLKDYEAFLAANSAEIAQPYTESGFREFVNARLTGDYLKCILLAVAPALYCALTSCNSNCTVTIRDILEEAVKGSPEIADLDWKTISNSQSHTQGMSSEAPEVKIIQISMEDLTIPVGQNPKWNIPKDYPFKDEPPLYITKPGIASQALCSEDIRKWCSVHNVKVKEFNHPCIIDDSFTNCQGLFCYCESFNQPVAIPKSAIHCLQMFAGCESFNQPIIIPNSVTNCYRMFYCCKSFNQPISIPDSVTSCYGMLGGCKSFNQHVEIPNSVIECQYMFKDCESFNQPVTIPDAVTKCAHMFDSCYALDRSIITGYKPEMR